ncbi:redoxin domain-containing protein [Cytophagaceae bacterium DM2B3-1]|uniref:Redoxin domain-containing protein n=1 Tax=Xanthocytophaga flava TaxID=3048013 RepID=A0ABT7CSM5_9BACT|nr:redoxin domain-containing protein [Xanthocytophaga flavus]MDJ1471351.1 redoxin domain-containing protein [Xanthocytophaga flavus]MDJ1496771.1 redoxin domain-containing protein [Xanthocytophaga flavus]
MQSYINARSLPFIPDFQPEFAFENSIADYSTRFFAEKTFIPQPLTVGEKAPSAELSRQQGVWQQLPGHLFSHSTVSIADLVEYKPLVISFYTPAWGEYSKLHLDLLDRSHQKISGLGGQLLVLTPLETDEISKLIKETGLQFNFIHDQNNQVAERFGVYSSTYPFWQRISGINGEVPFPATFVIAPNGAIVHSFYTEDLSNLYDIREVLTAIYTVRDIRQSA